MRIEALFEDYVDYVEALPAAPELRELMAFGRCSADRVHWLDEQLYMILCSRAVQDSKAMSVVRNCQFSSGIRGALALYQIATSCKGNRGDLRREALRDAARSPKQCADCSEVLSRISDWESAMRLYLKEYPEESVSDYERTKIVRSMMPTDLQSDMIRLEKKKYDDVYGYAVSQAPIRRDEEMRKRGQRMPISALDKKSGDQVDSEALERAIQVLRGQGVEGSSEEILSMLRRPGAGRGGATAPARGGAATGKAFDGECFYCKERGHRKQDCSKLTADRAKGVWAPHGQAPVPWVQGGQGGKGDAGKGGGTGRHPEMRLWLRPVRTSQTWRVARCPGRTAAMAFSSSVA